jgi:signal transduction histidine kinase
LLFVVFSCIWIPGQAQNLSFKHLDSLVAAVKTQKEDTAKCRTYNQISRIYIYKDSEKGIRYAKLGLQIAKKRNWQKGIGLSLLNIGMHQISKGNYDQSYSSLKSAEKILRNEKDYENLARTYNQLGILRANLAKFPESLDYFLKALTVFESLRTRDLRFSIASCHENIGTIYNLTDSYGKAIVEYKKAISILESLKDCQLELAMNIANLGNIYHKQGKYNLAIKNYQKSEKILLPLQDAFGLAFTNSWMGLAYLELKQYDTSIEKSDKALLAVNQVGDKELKTTIYQTLGYAWLKKGMVSNNRKALQMAFENLSASLKFHHELDNHEGLIKDYQYLSEYYQYQKDYAKSLEAHIAFSAYKDSVFNSKNKQSLQNLEDERTISLRDKEIQLNKVTLESKERQKWLYLFGIAALIVIGGLVFRQSQNRKKTNGKLQLLNAELDTANKTKARFFSILNHDLRSPVANLIGFLRLQKDSPELLDDESKKRMEAKTISSAENLLESMEDILLWSKGQMENFTAQPEKIAVSALFDDIQKHFSNTENVKILFENQGNESLFTDENYLKTILRNVVGNAVKALHNTPNATIILAAAKNAISISDNGPGGSSGQFRALYDEKEVVGIKTGMGLHLIRDLAKAINCKISVDTNPGSGTIFTLLFQ